MRLMSSFLGEQDIDEQTIVTFIQALPGFEGKIRYKLFHQEGQQALSGYSHWMTRN